MKGGTACARIPIFYKHCEGKGVWGLALRYLFEMAPFCKIEGIFFIIDFHVKEDKLIPQPSFIKLHRFRTKREDYAARGVTNCWGCQGLLGGVRDCLRDVFACDLLFSNNSSPMALCPVDCPAQVQFVVTQPNIDHCMP